MKKFLMWLGIGVLVLVMALVSGRNLIARMAVEMGTKKMTGFPLEIGAVNVGLLNGKLDVSNLKLMNPPDFEERIFVDLPEFRMDYRIGSMLAGAPHINDMLIHLKQIVIVKNTKGESNVQRLKGVTSSSDASKPAESGKPETKSKARYQVDLLRVQFAGDVIIKDYSKGKPTERRITLNINREYKNISDSTDITRLVLMSVLPSLPDIGVNMNDLKKNLGDVTDSAGKALQGVSEGVEKATKGLFESIKKSTSGQQQQENK